MNDLYAFGVLVVLPLIAKYLFASFNIDKSISRDVTICLFGEMNNYTVPIITKINELRIPTIIATNSLNSIPAPLLHYVKQSNYYKFIPYVKPGTSNFIVDTICSLSDTNLLIHDTAVVYGNRTVLNPSYFLPSAHYSEGRLMQKVWDDFKKDKVHGLVMIPYSNSTYQFIEEFIHDIIRFNITISTDWYTK